MDPLLELVPCFYLYHSRRQSRVPSEPLWLFHLLTALIPDCTGSLAGRLAGSLTLAAAPLLHGLLQVSGRQSLDMPHTQKPPYLH